MLTVKATIRAVSPSLISRKDHHELAPRVLSARRQRTSSIIRNDMVCEIIQINHEPRANKAPRSSLCYSQQPSSRVSYKTRQQTGRGFIGC